MSDTYNTHEAAPATLRRVSMLWPSDVHAAMATAASAHRRDFTHEVLTACDEHLARVAAAGVTPTAPASTPSPFTATPTTNAKE